MKKKPIAVFLAFLLCFALACQKKSETSLSLAHKAIEEANQKFIDASLRGDPAAVGALLTEDTLLLPPGGKMIQGKIAAEGYWRATWAVLKISDFKMEILNLSGKADFVHEVGRYTLKFHLQGKEVVDEGKYVVVWKQTAEGTWKKRIDIWNSNLPTQ
jgi:ketosteroid isomerase-like protein